MYSCNYNITHIDIYPNLSVMSFARVKPGAKSTSNCLYEICNSAHSLYDLFAEVVSPNWLFQHCNTIKSAKRSTTY